MTSAEILNVILAHVKTLEGEALSRIAGEEFRHLTLKSLKMDSLSLLELGMEVSNDIGVEADFLELGADLTMDEIADRLASSGN